MRTRAFAGEIIERGIDREYVYKRRRNLGGISSRCQRTTAATNLIYEEC